jgi:hypothetical protein
MYITGNYKKINDKIRIFQVGFGLPRTPHQKMSIKSLTESKKEPLRQ